MMLISNKLRIRKLKRESLKNSAIVRTEFRINQFITLRLMDSGKGFTYTVISVNDRKFSLYKFSFKEILEIINGKKDYFCMDEAYMDLIGTCDRESFIGDPDTMFWIYCYYIDAWVKYDYNWRLLRVDDAFPILHALYQAGDPKAKEVFKIEIVKALLSGYLPAIYHLTSIIGYYLNYFEFEEIIWLFEKCLKIVGFHDRSELKTQFFYFLKEKGFHYSNSYYFDNFEKAINYLNKALKIYPDDIETLKKLGIVYLKNGDYELARALLIYVIDLSSSKISSSDDNHSKKYYTNNYIVEAWCNLGTAYNRLHLFNKAITACNKVLDLDCDLVNPWEQIAIAYEGMGDFKLAKEAQKKFKKKEKKMRYKIKRRRIGCLLCKIRRTNEKKMKKMEKRILKRKRIESHRQERNGDSLLREDDPEEEINNFSLAISNVEFQDFSMKNKFSRSLYDEVIETYNFSDNQVFALLSEEYQTILDIINNHRIINREIVVAIRAKLIELVNSKRIEEDLINGNKAWRLRNY